MFIHVSKSERFILHFPQTQFIRTLEDSVGRLVGSCQFCGICIFLSSLLYVCFWNLSPLLAHKITIFWLTLFYFTSHAHHRQSIQNGFPHRLKLLLDRNMSVRLRRCRKFFVCMHSSLFRAMNTEIMEYLVAFVLFNVKSFSSHSHFSGEQILLWHLHNC